ncbi:hypothetical protein ACFL2K_04165 [Candidatus Margulisiibacteriota bacterium]
MKDDIKEQLYFESLLKFVFHYYDGFKIISIYTLINLAFYIAYYKVDDSFFVLSFPGLILILLLIMINVSLYMLLTRENKLKIATRKAIKEEEPEIVTKIWAKIDVDEKDKLNKGLEWRIIQGIMSVFCAIPICYLIYLLFSPGFCLWILDAVIFNLRFLAAFILGIVLFLLFYFELIYRVIRNILSSFK